MDNESIILARVTASHLALARGWINGVDLAELGKRYLAGLGDDDGIVDLRVVKSSLTRVLQELANAATRNSIPGGATLHRQACRINVDARGPNAGDHPPRIPFDTYVRSLEFGGEFSHDELLMAYAQAHPPVDSGHERALSRQSRLIERQINLLHHLENYLATPIRWEDKVSGWFAPALAERLETGGFKTIQQLAVAVAARPNEWFMAVAGIGASKASRIERYLRSNLGLIENELAMRGVAYLFVETIDPMRERRPTLEIADLTALSSSSQAAALPSFHLPGKEDLDGSQGRLRDRHNASAIEATNDYEAMKTWLKLKKSAVTVKLYEREITRLIAWSVQVRQRPMSSLSIEDAIEYRNFLGAIPPSILIKKGPRARTRTARGAQDESQSIAVAGFTQTALKSSSIKKALVIVSGFFSWLASVRYVTANPFVGVQVTSGLAGVGMGSTEAEDEDSMERARERRASVLGRVLPWEATAAINRYLDASPTPKESAFHARARFLFKLATMTGLRISEMAAARRDHLEYIEPDPVSASEGGWLLHVLGKRDKPREVPMPDELIAELQIYLAHRGLITLPSTSLAVDKGVFLIGAYPSHVASVAEAAASDLAIEARRKIDPLARVRKRKKAADGVRPLTLHLALKELFKVSLVSSQFKGEKTAEKMRKASAHWLRHTLATRAVASGTPIDVVAGIFGHANIATTSIYIQAERHRKLAEMRKLWSGANRAKPSSDVVG